MERKLTLEKIGSQTSRPVFPVSKNFRFREGGKSRRERKRAPFFVVIRKNDFRRIEGGSLAAREKGETRGGREEKGF